MLTYTFEISCSLLLKAYIKMEYLIEPMYTEFESENVELLKKSSNNEPISRPLATLVLKKTQLTQNSIFVLGVIQM